MKKIKYYVLGLLGTALLTVGLYACSNEDSVTMKNESSKVVTTKSEPFEGGKIAQIINGVAVPLYDVNEAKQAFIDDGLFIDVESIDITYGFNDELKKYEAFITIIGTQTAGGDVSATVGDLIIDGDDLNVPGDNGLTTFATHTCAGTNCLSCEYERSGFFGRITGCKACSKPAVEGQAGVCNHSQTSDGTFIGGLIKGLVKLV